MGDNVTLGCNKSLNYICSCVYVSNINKDINIRDFFVRYLLNNNINKKQIQDKLVNIDKDNLPKINEVFDFYNYLKNETTKEEGDKNEFISYNECPILCTLKRKKEPLVTNVKVDEFTTMVENNFDYKFTGESKIYPYELPKLPNNFGICCIVGASGSGKSTMLKEFDSSLYSFENKKFDDNAIVSNFDTPKIASEKLSASGLNSMPVWCRPRKVLSVGEGFRADLALNLDSYKIFDEFTSTIDRNVAKSTCNGIQRYIRKNNIHNIVFCSCHKDFIPFLKPDIVIDLDEEKVFDCRGEHLGETLRYKSTNQMKKICGVYLGSITI